MRTAILAIPLAGAAQAALVTLTPVADAFVTTGPSPANTLAGNNYGGAGAMGVAGTSSSKGEFQSVMRFDMNSVLSTFDTRFGPGLWKIDSVSLRLTSAAAGNPIFNSITAGSFSIKWMQDDSWTEGTGNPGAPTTNGISYTSLQGLLGGSDTSLGTYAFDGITGVSTTWNLNLPTAFRNDIMAGGNLGFHVVAADATVSYLFNARSFGTEASRPLLSITASAIPEPGSSLLLSAAAGLLLMKRNRRDAARA